LGVLEERGVRLQRYALRERWVFHRQTASFPGFRPPRRLKARSCGPLSP
jgi:hypothetical protein